MIFVAFLVLYCYDLVQFKGVHMKESKTLEFKSEISNSFLKTVSAFANYSGGTIFFGIDDQGNKVQLSDLNQKCLDLENRINDSISPKPDFELSIDNGTIKLDVFQGKFTPYLYKGKAYRRSDTATIEVDHEELRSLVLSAEHLSFEQLFSDLQNLQFNALERKLREHLGVNKLSKDLLRTLGLLSQQGEYNNAAAIVADQNNFYGIDIARFGDSINEIMDRNTITNQSIFDQYDQAFEFFKRYYQYEVIEDSERKTKDLIPNNAFREVLANALVHRDWSINSHVRISMFKDRIEINSPGGLPRGINLDEYLNGSISCLRNPIIGNIFFRLHYIEMFGTGIRRTTSEYNKYILKPKFKITDHVISVTLPIISNKLPITPEEKIIYDLLKEKGKLSSSDLVSLSKFNKAKVIRLINHLLEEEFIKKEGNGRSTLYYVD